MGERTTGPEVALRITVRRPPPGVAFALQRGATDLVEASERSPDTIVFDFSVRVGKTRSGDAPRLLGPFAQGPPSARFVYVNSGRRAAQASSHWDRRAKVPLGAISTPMIERALQVPGARLETEFDGTAADGGPTCATVRSTTWRLVGG